MVEERRRGGEGERRGSFAEVGAFGAQPADQCQGPRGGKRWAWLYIMILRSVLIVP